MHPKTPSPGIRLALAIAATLPLGAYAADSGDALEEIIVHAQRVEQRLQDVPVAVTPVSAAELESKGLHDLVQLTLAVPSLEVTTDNAFTLRGVGSQIFSANVDSSVGVTVDDISLGVPVFMSNAAFVDVEQVEALTGPQGLLFGRNASAGMMNVVTKRPVLGKSGQDLSLEYDGRGPRGQGLVGTAIFNLPVSENSALRLNFLDSSQDPIAKVTVNTSPNMQDKQQRLMGKAKWLWEPGKGTSVYAIGDYSRERGIGGIWDDTWRSTGQPSPPGNDAAFAAADGVTPGPQNFTRGINGADFRSVDTYGLSVNVSHEISDALTLSNIVGWRHYTLSYNLDSDNSSSQGLDVNGGDQSYNQYSEELRLAFKSGRIDGQAGAYAFASTNDASAQFKGANGFSFLGVDNFLFGTNAYHLTGRSLAAFGQVQFHATDKLQFIAGGRLTNDHVAVDAKADNYTPTAFTWPPFLGFLNGVCQGVLPCINIFGPLNQDYHDSRSNTNFSYKLGTQYNFTPDAMGYVTLSSGYKGPAMKTNLPVTGEDPYLRPETVDDLEVGMKSMFLDRHLRVNVAAFIEKFNDFQVQAFNPAGVSTLTNAKGVRATGVEVNTTLKAGSHLTFNYNATFEDSHFTDFAGDPCYTLQPASTCPNGQYFQGAGLKTPTAASYHGTLEGIYEVPLGSGKLELEANWYHRTAINFSAAAAPYATIGPIDVFGANLAWKLDNGFSAALFCKNCTNEIYPNYVGSDPGDSNVGVLSTINRWGYNSVRTVGVLLSYRH